MNQEELTTNININGNNSNINDDNNNDNNNTSTIEDNSIAICRRHKTRCHIF